jgi:hypothetical protein
MSLFSVLFYLAVSCVFHIWISSLYCTPFQFSLSSPFILFSESILSFCRSLRVFAFPVSIIFSCAPQVGTAPVLDCYRSVQQSCWKFWGSFPLCPSHCACLLRHSRDGRGRSRRRRVAVCCCVLCVLMWLCETALSSLLVSLFDDEVAAVCTSK